MNIEDILDGIRSARGNRGAEFHAHLDVCRQCAEHPFELCPQGAKLLLDAYMEKESES